MQLSEQEIIRREKLDTLRSLGINPYPANLFPVSHTSKQVKSNFKEGEKVILAGRIMSDRDMGKASFVELQDSEGRIQLYFNRDMLCPGEDKTLYTNKINHLKNDKIFKLGQIRTLRSDKNILKEEFYSKMIEYEL